MARPLRLVALCAPLLLAGCVLPGASLEPGAVGYARCEDPFPCGDEWPAGLEGPFALAQVLALDIRSHDGIPLETYAYLPALPEGVKAPVVLMSTPYPGACASNTGGCSRRGDDPSFTTRMDVATLVEAGYAVVIANVRGTGNSGGCFGMGGRDEQLDQVALVEQVAAAEWSNGRVGMIGHSYPSFTAWMAAVQAPPALKTVVVSGHMTDLYLAYHTPQGAASLHGGWFQAGYSGSLNFVPPLGGGAAHVVQGHPPVAAQRACPQAVHAALETQRSALVDARDAAYWEERRISSRLGDVKAAVLSVSGFEDSALLFHAFQDDSV
ncbi:MAG TPA: CocE/NonD family hydrolase, partial [Candidatus Thermoplasmatota archaeon]|nr:CocE/NonD family hydrolase [Candidatus Thermoplasmatota archaeon]